MENHLIEKVQLYPSNFKKDDMNQKNLLPLSTENILQLLKKGLGLSFVQKGQDYFALCPFRQEKSSSFAFEPEKTIFKCFGCGFGAGNVFKV